MVWKPMTNDPASERDLAAYEQAYRASGFEVVQAAQRKRLLLELLERLQPRTVVEVGCGLDTLANHWRGADRFIIVEPAAAFAAEARRLTIGRSDVTVVEQTLEAAVGQLPTDLDLILLSALLHEVPDASALLRAARELCAAHTLVHVNVPNARSLHRMLAVEMGLIQDVTEISDLQAKLQQHRTFTMDTLSAALADAGFDVIDQGSYFVKPFAHAQMQALRATGILTDQMIDGLWGLARRLPDMGSEIYVNARRAD
jgi:hypothetical protein